MLGLAYNNCKTIETKMQQESKNDSIYRTFKRE